MKTIAISQIIEALDKLSKNSEKDRQHFEVLAKCMRFKDFEAAYRLADSGSRGFFRSAFQHKLSELKPLIKTPSGAQKKEQIQKLLNVVKQGSVEELAKLLETNSVTILNESVKDIDVNYETVLDCALQRGDPVIVEKLLQYDAELGENYSVNKTINNNGDTALHFACTNNMSNLVVQLIQQRVDVNICNNRNMTPLFIACAFDRHDIARLLLNKEANPNIAMTVDAEHDHVTPFKLVMSDFELARDMIECGYQYDDRELAIAKKINHALYEYMKKPLREQKHAIIGKGSAEGMVDKYKIDPSLRPLFSRLYFENPKLKDKFAIYLKAAYQHKNKILQPLLKLIVLAAAGRLKKHDDTNKNLTIVIVDADDIHKVTAGDDDGQYKGKNTIYVAGGGDPREAFGSLLHEMKHYADKQVYGNMNEPYQSVEKSEFVEIQEQLREKCKKLELMTAEGESGEYSEYDLEMYETMQSIFDDYLPIDQSAEVMVKVPEILGACGMGEGYSWLEKNEKGLLSFYENNFNRVCDELVQSVLQDEHKNEASKDPFRHG